MKNITHIKQWSVWLLLFLAAWPAEAKKWKTKEQCVMLPNPANDGDSFHVKWHSREYIFRLLFVDCPETDMSLPDRVKEQADYFGITPEDAVKIGLVAEKFTADFLATGFTVYTQLDDARGRSEMDRDYGVVAVGDQYLMEALVARGLARIHGLQEMSPDCISVENMRMRLDKAEADAKRNKLGAWAFSQTPAGPSAPPPSWGVKPTVAPAPAMPTPVSMPTIAAPIAPAQSATTEIQEHTMTIQRTVAVYSLKESNVQVGYLTPGKEITVLRAESSVMARIRFKASEDKIYEAQCLRADLGL